jgi:hypothetical protein
MVPQTFVMPPINDAKNATTIKRRYEEESGKENNAKNCNRGN